MNNCGTCEHWGNAKGKIFPGNLNGHGDQKKCFRIADSADFSNSVLENEPAYTEDGSGYYSALMTKPDFGCVLWEPKKS